MEARFEARFDRLEGKLDRVVDADVRIRERLARLEAENDRAWGGLDEFVFSLDEFPFMGRPDSNQRPTDYESAAANTQGSARFPILRLRQIDIG